MRWIGFIVTTAANVTVFTPSSDSTYHGRSPMDWWEEHFEDHVGNYGVVDDPKQADRIVSAIVNAGFDVIFAEERK